MMATTTVNFDAIHCYDPDDIPLGPNAIRADADGREYVLRTRPDETWVFVVGTDPRDGQFQASVTIMPSEEACKVAGEMIDDAARVAPRDRVRWSYRKVET
jgi:hypothetical protein